MVSSMDEEERAALPPGYFKLNYSHCARCSEKVARLHFEKFGNCIPVNILIYCRREPISYRFSYNPNGYFTVSVICPDCRICVVVPGNPTQRQMILPDVP